MKRMKRLLLLAAFERTSQMAESDFFAASPRHECPLLEHATPRTHCQAARGPSLLDVLWLVPPRSGGGTMRASPLPLSPLCGLTWSPTLGFLEMPSWKAVVFPRCHSFGSAYLTASHRVSHLTSKCPTLNTMGHS